MRLNTARLDGLASDILASDSGGEDDGYNQMWHFDHSQHDQHSHISKFPTFSGWLKLAGKHRRWVVLKGSHLLWSPRQPKITDDRQIEQRKRFKNWVNVMNIQKIIPLKGQDADSFCVLVGVKRSKYVWKAENMSKRDD